MKKRLSCNDKGSELEAAREPHAELSLLTWGIEIRTKCVPWFITNPIEKPSIVRKISNG